MRIVWTKERREELERRWYGGEKKSAICRAMRITKNALAGRTTKYNLRPRAHQKRALAPNHPAMVQGRTIFRGAVTGAGTALKPGSYQRKLGDRVSKGAWKGMPIYSLTLEERATCPSDCKLLAACYGNTMHLAKRMRHGAQLEQRIWSELHALDRRHPHGFVVRLHILGDFYSVDYALLWAEALIRFPALHVFGYTAWQANTPIGAVIAWLRSRRWDRFAVRTSGAARAPRTHVIDAGEDAGNSIICPAQTGRTQTCSTCALCWSPAFKRRSIAFIAHGSEKRAAA